jgi:hypothetical protein
MNTAHQATTSILIRFRRYTVLAWYALQSPKLTGILLLILLSLLAGRLVIPQQVDPNMTAEAWSAGFPIWLQPLSQLLYSLGFSRIFQSILFWAPLALLTLNSLLALAAYSRPSWQRVRGGADNTLDWQHPLARRAEYSMRLPEAPDILIDALKESLRGQGFVADSLFEENQRLVSAGRRRWAWLSVVLFYGALLLLSLAFLISYFSLRIETMTLFPGQVKNQQLLGGAFELTAIDAANQAGRLTFTPTANEPVSSGYGWRLYLPTFVADMLLLPIAVEPVFMIEAQNAAGELQRLTPTRDELSVTTRLVLPLDEANTPLSFVISAEKLTFQVSPVVVDGQNRLNIQVRRQAETLPSENLMVGLDDSLVIDAVTVTITSGHSLKVIVRRDKALWLYGVSLIAAVSSLLVFYFLPPWQLWLIPEVKGRGGQLYGVVEKLGPAKGMGEFLEHLFD